jgi:Xaa-Pro aminopeptidase
MASVLAILLLLLPSRLGEGGEPLPVILTLREQERVRDRWLDERLGSLLRKLMRRERIDMWILIAREYNEDPVLSTMLPASWMSSRRRTVLVCFDGGKEALELLAVSRYDVGGRFRAAWNIAEEPDQWKALAGIVRSRNPQRIGINRSETFALADGMSASELEALRASLDERFLERIVSAERLAIGWLEERTSSEMTVYPAVCRLSHRIMAEGFSERVIQPGVTSVHDVEWWYRERIRSLGLETWFHPEVSLQRAPGHARESAESAEKDTVILRGDLLHLDFGIRYLGFCTDQQQHAYVLRQGESSAPEDLRRALARANRVQDILMAEFEAGRTGNEILAQALSRARAEGLDATIYSHPLGYHGHGAGPVIGLWDEQEGVPGLGDYELFPNTVFSVELGLLEPIEAWEGMEVRILLEEDAYFDGEQIRFLDGRQTELILIP